MNYSGMNNPEMNYSGMNNPKMNYSKMNNPKMNYSKMNNSRWTIRRWIVQDELAKMNCPKMNCSVTVQCWPFLTYLPYTVWYFEPRPTNPKIGRHYGRSLETLHIWSHCKEQICSIIPSKHKKIWWSTFINGYFSMILIAE